MEVGTRFVCHALQLCVFDVIASSHSVWVVFLAGACDPSSVRRMLWAVASYSPVSSLVVTDGPFRRAITSHCGLLETGFLKCAGHYADEIADEYVNTVVPFLLCSSL
jgi:hypothetical protein